jgi:medium-chain acyl-[acyl-carrier-protein] hydrolase
MGALLAFELARCGRRRGLAQPLHLVASANRAPQLPDPHPPLYCLPDHELIREMDERYNGIPRTILDNPEMLELFLPAIRADLTILDTYQYGAEPPLACPITVFGGEQDPSVSRAELEPWRVQTTGAFRLHMFAGDHFFVQSAQELVLQVLNQELAQYLL